MILFGIAYMITIEEVIYKGIYHNSLILKHNHIFL